MTASFGGLPISDPEDEILWGGKAEYRRRRTAVGLVASIVAFLLLVVVSLHEYIYPPVFIIPGILIIVNLWQIVKFEGVRYEITRRAVILEQSLLSFKRRKELPIESLREVKLRPRTRFLRYQLANGETIALALLREDIERVRNIVADAKTRISTRSRKF